jgi:hypothetical protein
MENRNGLVVDTRVSLANGTAERKAAIEMVENVPGKHQSPWVLTKDTTAPILWNECAF